RRHTRFSRDWSSDVCSSDLTRTTAALPDLHRRLFSAGIRTAYMVDYPIADSPAAVEILRGFLEAGECSIGTQLHPWVNPPFDEEIGRASCRESGRRAGVAGP